MLSRVLFMIHPDGNRQIRGGLVRGPTACGGLPPSGGLGGAWAKPTTRHPSLLVVRLPPHNNIQIAGGSAPAPQ